MYAYIRVTCDEFLTIKRKEFSMRVHRREQKQRHSFVVDRGFRFRVGKAERGTQGRDPFALRKKSFYNLFIFIFICYYFACCGIVDRRNSLSSGSFFRLEYR
jgi:hypothetical protein